MNLSIGSGSKWVAEFKIKSSSFFRNYFTMYFLERLKLNLLIFSESGNHCSLLYMETVGLWVAVCGGKVCQNGGRLDPDTCVCECKAPYSGSTCEKGKVWQDVQVERISHVRKPRCALRLNPDNGNSFLLLYFLLSQQFLWMCEQKI